MTEETLTALRALAHCERRFYLTELEGHHTDPREPLPPPPPEAIETALSDEALGVRGQVRALTAPLRGLLLRPPRPDDDPPDAIDRLHATAVASLLGAHHRVPPPPVEIGTATPASPTIRPTPTAPSCAP